MLTTIVAILGTIAGSLLTWLLQHVSQRTERKDAEAATHRQQAHDAVNELATALADHRRAMWVREDLRLRGEDWADARTASHATRSAITAPLLRVSDFLPSLGPAAQAAVRATYALRGASDEADLNVKREHAIKTADEFVAAAGTALAT